MELQRSGNIQRTDNACHIPAVQLQVQLVVHTQPPFHLRFQPGKQRLHHGHNSSLPLMGRISFNPHLPLRALSRRCTQPQLRVQKFHAQHRTHVQNDTHQDEAQCRHHGATAKHPLHSRLSQRAHRHIAQRYQRFAHPRFPLSVQQSEQSAHQLPRHHVATKHERPA